MAVRSSVGKLVTLSSTIALNPIVTASLLYALTKGPAGIRYRLLNTFTSLRDPQTFARVVRALKWLFALGTASIANRTLNQLALNTWRMKSEKSRWSFSSEVAVVTGGCSGIGEQVVKRLINKGVKVAVLDIQQLPPSLQGNANVEFFACDVTKPSAVNTTADLVRASLGNPSILVNNAGVAQAHTIMATSPEYLKKIFDVNVLSNWYTVKAFLPSMVTKNKGHIVTVASAASFVSAAGMTDYCATKAAVLAFHEGLNQEVQQRHHAPNILSTSIHPGWVRTPLILSFEKQLRAYGRPIMEISVVADAIVKQIFSCSGGQVFLPRDSGRIAGLRSWPNWVQETLRAGMSKSALQAAQCREEKS
ncbi:dehydrogenase/reductase SDR family member 8 precursor [Byssothecium circinans]|uniref:Short-chain dehydrogenase/reductase 3 n=1 Tax=Byssothecium circinans TaxID=147558 RepID=A0A6A5UC73_9PLEO|nr:dehydrogenase/reductase SDR family member 8 precursor [Byssothecium circinans]